MSARDPSNGASPDVFTPDEAARYVRLSRKKFDEILKRGEIPHKREGRSIRITREALDEWLRTPSQSDREKSSAA